MSYDPDVEAILGGKPDPHSKLPKPPSRAQRKVQAEKERKENTETTIVQAKNGVTVYWLSQVFGMTPETVRKRLGSCPPLSQHGKGYKYDIATAAGYLVDPQIDIEKYLKQLRATDLPPSLQKEIWDARLKRQKWESQAGDLWHTQDVMAVLSSTFSIIKSTIQLWPDTVERQEGLTEEQRLLLVRLGDTLQDEVYQGLLEMARERNTKASIGDLDEDDDNDDNVEDVL